MRQQPRGHRRRWIGLSPGAVVRNGQGGCVSLIADTSPSPYSPAGPQQLQRANTVPTVWIPPGALRDRRDLPRPRMVLVRERTQLKNCIHAALARYAIALPDVSDLFEKRGGSWLWMHLDDLPTAYVKARMLDKIEALTAQVRLFDRRMIEVFETTPEIDC